QALFGTRWDSQQPTDEWSRHYKEFESWYAASRPAPVPSDAGCRILILNFCLAMSRYVQPVSERRDKDQTAIPNAQDLFVSYRKQKMLAIELFVHFHDYYFAFADQHRLYVMSIWASWTKVAAPYTRLNEYVIRTLATIVAGSGLAPRPALELA